jgi:histidinol phosphatase-like PHP family hydrolase
MTDERLRGGDKGGQAFPLVDYHVHLTDQFTIDMAVDLAQKRNAKFGIVQHPGPQFGLATDDDLRAYIDRLREYPVYVGLQPVYRGWAERFSKALLDDLDYVLMDADTVPLGDHHYLEIWRHDNYIEDVDQFMGAYMAHIESILKYEPITIFARPTYLPVNFARYYDELWTRERVTQMIEWAREKSIAFEISTPMHVPKKEIILQAKNAGIKFTFGTNARNADAGKLHYGLQMARECRLSRGDLLFL